MNIGELVEINDTDDIFKDPKHSYTKELLRAIPEPDPVGRKIEKEKIRNLNLLRGKNGI